MYTDFKGRLLKMEQYGSSFENQRVRLVFSIISKEHSELNGIKVKSDPVLKEKTEDALFVKKVWEKTIDKFINEKLLKGKTFIGMVIK